MTHTTDYSFQLRWVGERLLLAAWLGDLTVEDTDGTWGESVEIRLDGRTLTDSEARTFVDLVQAGALDLGPHAVYLAPSGQRLLRRWSRYVPVGGAA